MTIAGLVFALHMVKPMGPKGALVGAALEERRSMEKVAVAVKGPEGEPEETRPSWALGSPLGLLENWWDPDPEVPAARLDWKTVVWTLAQSSPPGLLSHQSEP